MTQLIPRYTLRRLNVTQGYRRLPVVVRDKYNYSVLSSHLLGREIELQSIPIFTVLCCQSSIIRSSTSQGLAINTAVKRSNCLPYRGLLWIRQ
jgi:hypothetical protein